MNDSAQRRARPHRPPIKAQIDRTLDRIDRPMAFCTAGAIDPVLPGLQIDGLGLIGLPLTPDQARRLIEVCEQAPYGQGEKTLVDTSVRRVWALSPDRFELTNPAWSDTVERMLDPVGEQLGLNVDRLDADLHQLVLYEPGSFFLPHQDGEKTPGMVATLVVVLPSVHEGGELIVRHAGREVVYDFGGEDGAFRIQFAAFYADCEHEVRPVRTGHRLALIYNLRLKGRNTAIAAPDHREQITALTELLIQWADEPASFKLIVPLDHEYTQPGLRPGLLKGTDRARTDALMAAADAAGLKSHLALITLWQIGIPDFSQIDYYGREPIDAEGVDMDEVLDESFDADFWVDGAGQVMEFGTIALDQDDLIDPASPMTDGDTRQTLHGYTGNAGMDLERWYKKAAVVLWPADEHHAVLCEAGLDVAITQLQATLDRGGDAAKHSDFANTILHHWSDLLESNMYRLDHPAPGAAAAALLKLDDPDLAADYIRLILPADPIEHAADRLPDLCERIGWTEATAALSSLFENSTAESLTRDAALLESLSQCADEDEQTDRRKACAIAADRFISRLAAIAADGSITRRHAARFNRYRPAVDFDIDFDDSEARDPGSDAATILVRLWRTLAAIEADDAMARLADHILAHQSVYDLRDVQVPALLAISETDAVKTQAFRRWAAACRATLHAESSTRPTAPTDWARPADLSCDCELCRELSEFLADPRQPEHRFAVRKDLRQHLHQIIERHGCDTTHVTERKGRPYTLVCKKTDASYRRALARYENDRQRIAAIDRALRPSPRSRP